MAGDILIIDDEKDIRELVAGILEDEGYSTRIASKAEEALTIIEARRPTLIFLDIWLEGSHLDGLQLLEKIKGLHPEIQIVMISGHGNIETAVTAIKKGAYDFIEKPFKADRLLLVAQRALEQLALKREIKDLKTRSGTSEGIIGQTNSIAQFRQQLERVASTNARVLFSGVPGVGKELSARVLHQLSSRSQGPFIAINAATITPEKMEEALFGIEEIGDQSRKIGALEEAHDGILFIDEIADMPNETQSKILRALTDQNFQRIGGSVRVHVDVRVISSTSRNIPEEIAAGRFREDLYHRLGVVLLRVPSLCERREDIPLLIEHFMQQIALASGLLIRKISDEAMAILQTHDWPGNVRQLRNVVERIMILSTGEVGQEVTVEMLPQEVWSSAPSLPGGIGGEKLLSLPLREAREAFEKEYLIAQINRYGGNISRTAEFIEMERSALHRKLRTLGL